MVEFKIKPHTSRDAQVVEIYVDGVFRAALYPELPNQVRLISSHFDGEPKHAGEHNQVWQFAFKPGV